MTRIRVERSRTRNINASIRAYNVHAIEGIWPEEQAQIFTITSV